MNIEKVNYLNINKVKKFISKVPMFKNIEDNLFEKMVALIDVEDVKGIVTYETYQDIGLIRYFIFQKDVDFLDLKKMLETMFIGAREDHLKKVISVVDQEDLALFFRELNFLDFDIDKLYIEELSIKDVVENARGLIYEL